MSLRAKVVPPVDMYGGNAPYLLLLDLSGRLLSPDGKPRRNVPVESDKREETLSSGEH
jgi:hypothetical protein